MNGRRLAVVGGVLFVGLLVVVLVEWNRHPEGPQPWLQFAVDATTAIATVAAVVAALWVAWKSGDENRELRRRERQREAVRVTLSIGMIHSREGDVDGGRLMASWTPAVLNRSNDPLYDVEGVVTTNDGSTYPWGPIDVEARTDATPSRPGAHPAEPPFTWTVEFWFRDAHDLWWGRDTDKLLTERRGPGTASAKTIARGR